MFCHFIRTLPIGLVWTSTFAQLPPSVSKHVPQSAVFGLSVSISLRAMEASGHSLFQDGSGNWLLAHELSHDVVRLSGALLQAIVVDGAGVATFTAVHLPRLVAVHPITGEMMLLACKNVLRAAWVDACATPRKSTPGHR